MSSWFVKLQRFLVSTLGGIILYLGIILFESGLPKSFTYLSSYTDYIAIVLGIFGVSVGIYGLGIGSKKSIKDRLIEFVYHLMEGAA